MLVSAILVHYRTPELLAPCLAALRASAEAANLDLEAIVVDNSGEVEVAAIAELGARLVTPGANLGFAGGVNRGGALARGSILLPTNPDVVVTPGCVGALVAALEGGFDVAGPSFSWDAQHRLLIPPTEVRTRHAELRRRLAATSPARAQAARAAWRQHARRHWMAGAPLPSRELSGALLAIRSSAWQTFGGFDEGYQLYFEETDWLRRLALAGGRSAYVPAAQAHHAFARSTAREPRAAAWFAESALRFARRAWGQSFVERLARLDRGTGWSPTPAVATTLRLAGSGPRWVEVAPSLFGFPAAAEFIDQPSGSLWTLPAGVAGSLPVGTTLQAREVAADGTELGSATLEVA